MARVERLIFEQLVARALDELPVSIRRHIANVAIVVEDLADEDTLDAADIDDAYQLFGFYRGVPLTERTHHYGMVTPDVISIFRQPIEAVCATPAEMRECIRRTVRHEIAHYFGIDDERLEEIDAY